MFKNSDWRDLHEYYSDEHCIRYTVGRVLEEHETWREVAIRTGHWLLHGYGPYAIEEKSSRKVIGMAGLWHPLEWPGPEITWHLSRKYFGKGFAGEATQAVLKMTRQYVPEVSFVSVIHPDNRASIKLAVALNAKFEKMIKFRNTDHCLYRHL